MHGVGLLALLAALAGALLLALTPLDPRLTYGFQRNTTATPASAPITPADGLPYTRRNFRFDSHGTALDAWLYTPLTAVDGAAAVRHPVMIMAHGLGAQKELGLHRFADAFARAGLAVLVFDYRTFGGSEGEPRHWVSPRRHLEDWNEALRVVKVGWRGGWVGYRLGMGMLHAGQAGDGSTCSVNCVMVWAGWMSTAVMLSGSREAHHVQRQQSSWLQD
jgi:hypothetical protein